MAYPYQRRFLPLRTGLMASYSDWEADVKRIKVFAERTTECLVRETIAEQPRVSGCSIAVFLLKKGRLHLCALLLYRRVCIG